MTATGWLYHNPDTGTEWSANHPVKSGECIDAERLRRATRENLLQELLAGWEVRQEEREQSDKHVDRLARERLDLITALKAVCNEVHWALRHPDPLGALKSEQMLRVVRQAEVALIFHDAA